MSDLCYNCGDCHLPRKCPVSLKQCEICKNYGHTYNFCPLSVRHKDPGYMYWGLCHNCDKWHLPNPCEFVLYTCKQCGHLGHKEFFCPVDALSRTITFTPQEPALASKRKRIGDSDAEERFVPTYVHPETVNRIKLDAAHEVFNFQSKGYTQEQIIQFFSKLLMQANGAPFGGATVKGEHSADDDLLQKIFSNKAVTPKIDSPQTGIGHRNGAGIQNPATPTPAMRSTSHGEANEGVYSAMHERFGRGDFAQSQSQSQQTPSSYSVVAQNNTTKQNGTYSGPISQGHPGNDQAQIAAQASQAVAPPGEGGSSAAQAPAVNHVGQDENMSSTNEANLAYLLANALAENNHSQGPAQAHGPQNTGFPPMTDENGNSFQFNPLQQRQLPILHSRPEADHVPGAMGYVTAPNIDERPAPELKKNGEPKKRTGRPKKKA